MCIVMNKKLIVATRTNRIISKLLMVEYILGIESLQNKFLYFNSKSDNKISEMSEFNWSQDS